MPADDVVEEGDSQVQQEVGQVVAQGGQPVDKVVESAIRPFSM